MQKTFILFYCGLLAAFPADSYSQILITEMGPVRFYNSLDSAEAIKLNAIASQCYCFLRLEDSTHLKLLKLDIKTDTSRTDSLYYMLDYNNLSGNYSSSDSLAETAGIYIKARDTVLKAQIILRLLDYGIHHYSELKERSKTGNSYDNRFVAELLKQKTPVSFKRAADYCK